VKVFRNGTDLKPEDETVRLKAQDKVRLITPAPPACRKALQAEADTNWRDYAIVPGTTPFDKRMAKVIDARPRTIRIMPPPVSRRIAYSATTPRSGLRPISITT